MKVKRKRINLFDNINRRPVSFLFKNIFSFSIKYYILNNMFLVKKPLDLFRGRQRKVGKEFESITCNICYYSILSFLFFYCQ